MCKIKNLSEPLNFQLKNPACFCKLCGRFLISEKDYCTSCRAKLDSKNIDKGNEKTYDKVFTVYPYQGNGGKILTSWKNREVRGFAEIFAEVIFNFLNSKDDLQNLKIVPVPPRPKKLKTKGWDQIEDMAKILEYKFGISILRCLKRKDGLSQKSLSLENRKTNLKGKIHLADQKIKLPKKIIILDDVMTTGSTLKVCTEVLKSAGCKIVYCLCLFFD